MDTKSFNYKKQSHVKQVNSESFENKEKMSTSRDWDWQPKIKVSKHLSHKQDLIGAVIFAIILVLLLTFMPKSAISTEKKIKDEITEWYENTTISIANEIVSLGNSVISVPDKIGTGLSNFWQETKTYQIESWSKTREENPVVFSTIDKLKEYFVPTGTKTNE
jgi:hypothetical protein